MNIDGTELKGFAQGAHIRLRPVQEGDLGELARLRAQIPAGRRPLPWTLQRLKKAYDNPEKPGLWSEHSKTYICTLLDGTAVGLLIEEFESWIQAFSISLHIDDRQAERRVLGRELLQVYMDYLNAWFDPGMVVCEILDNDPLKAAWLEAAGFVPDLHMQRTDLCNGAVVGRYAYVWRSAARLAGPDLSTGEPQYPLSGSSRSTGLAAANGGEE